MPVNFRPSSLPARRTDGREVTKIRSSHFSRFSRSSKLVKAEVDDFHIRKSLFHYVREQLEATGRQLYYQRVYVLAKNVQLDLPHGSGESLSEHPEPDYRAHLQERLERIFAICALKKFTNDNLSGLFVCMGDYTLFVVEGPEELVAFCFEEVATIEAQLWTASRVFLVEDKIEQTYYKRLVGRRAPAINTNEKFPPATPNDPNLMGLQHRKLVEKVRTICETLSTQLREKDTSNTEDALPSDPYNKLLPEVQRIDLVLACTRFYQTVQAFALSYRVVLTRPDDEAYFWPIPNNYMPLGIFDRSPYDVNLTFSDYGKEVAGKADGKEDESLTGGEGEKEERDG